MFKKLRQLLTFLIGEFSWHPPAWSRRAGGASWAWVSHHRRASIAILLAINVVAIGGWKTWDWYRRQPKPVTISVSVDAPGVTPLDEKLVPQSLVIRFGGSVATLELTRNAWRNLPPGILREALQEKMMKDQMKLIAKSVHLDPPAEGNWHWQDDRELVFEPKNDWPADQKYRIKLDRTLFAPHVRLERYEVEMKTPSFVATMPKIEFYTDPTDPTVKQVVATFEFTHRVEIAEVEKRLNLGVIGDSEIFKKGTPRYTLTAGQHQRVAFLRTSGLILPEHEDFVRVTLDKGLPTLQGGAVTSESIEKKVLVPDLYSFFKIKNTHGEIVRNKEGEPEQIVFVETSCAAKSQDLLKNLHVYLLPKKKVEKDEDPDAARWSSPDEIDEEVLSESTLLPVKVIPTDPEDTDAHSFKISLETDGQLYLTVSKGTRAMGGYLLGEDYASILNVPELPREIEIQGNGGVLALNGERKLSIKSRGVRTIEYEIARVPADQINHLVSQTRGEFQNPRFVNDSFDQENIARISTERQSINLKSKFKANYSSFDFSSHLKPAEDGGSALQGLFFLRAREWQPPKKKLDDDQQPGTVHDSDSNSADANSGSDADNQNEEEESDDSNDDNRPGDSRFILVTDLGIVVKENTDGSRDVFLASLKTGAPLGGVQVQVLAKNGVPIVTAETAADGHLNFSSLGDPKREKTPVAFVARLGNDVAFMPWSRDDRLLDYSRFDIGGVESRSGADLDAFVFTERGIYRPGDEIRIGLIVKQRDWGGKLDGLPVETEVIDARGTSVQVRKLALPAGGFAETSYQTAYESATGNYSIHVYLVRDGKRSTLLGETSVVVKEFLPDRMKIESRLSKSVESGWVTPDDLHAAITLRNLYGTPASNRRIKAHLTLSPSGFQFDEFPGYSFFDPLLREKKELKFQDIDLGESKTNDQGAASFDLNLKRFDDATYEMTFYAEGFEADSGRSVNASNRVLVSSLPYVIGVKPDGDLSYIKYGDKRAVEWVAIDPSLKKIAAGKLEARLIESVYVSVLTKKDDGDYVYESVPRENLIRREDVSIGVEGLDYALPTDVPGNYVLQLWQKDNEVRVSQVSFSVVGRGEVTRSLEKNAELDVKLSRAQYNTGDDIEISIVAPYTGSGLITIERDKVYAYTWFKADRTSSVQHIRVPADFEGTGYVNVCFVRGLDSKEVFMSPLSYAVDALQGEHRKAAPADHAACGEPGQAG